MPEYDYSTPGGYFVTVCIQNRACVLGDISEAEMRLSPVGEMVDSHLQLAIDRFPGIALDNYVLMPNHLHAVITIGMVDDAEAVHSDPDDGSHGGLHLRGSDSDPGFADAPDGRHRGLRLRGGEGSDSSLEGETTSLFQVMHWFKSATTNEYSRRVRTEGWPRFPGRLWQPNYYEHIVRDQQDLDRIRTYVAHNPARWEQDSEYLPICRGYPRRIPSAS